MTKNVKCKKISRTQDSLQIVALFQPKFLGSTPGKKLYFKNLRFFFQKDIFGLYYSQLGVIHKRHKPCGQYFGLCAQFYLIELM